MDIVAGVVLFNPDVDRLRENLTSLLSQVDRVLLVDNASSNPRDIDQLALEFAGLRLLRNNKNLGIAHALNQIVGWAEIQGSDWVLLLDQDSVCGPELVSILARTVSSGIAMVVPSILDRNLASKLPLEADISDTDYAITSGALSNVEAWKSIAGYDETLFIDYVDFDYCLRLRMAGYRIVRNSGAELLHEIGNSRRHGRVVAYNHSAFRSYHMARDMLAYARKHRRSPAALKVNRRGVLATYAVLARKAAIVAIYETDRVSRVRALFQGAVDETFRRRR